jgi:hypothetical protein
VLLVALTRGDLWTTPVLFHRRRFEAIAIASSEACKVAFARGQEELVPFDQNDPREFQMRSPLAFPQSFKCLVRLYFELWFCIDRQLVLHPGTESFFKYFGGEAVYFAFMEDPAIGLLLEQLGEAVVVEARIASKDLTVFQEFAFARTLVCYFARTINPEFHIEGREGYLSKSVEPTDIVVVHPHKEFVKTYSPRRSRKRTR